MLTITRTSSTDILVLHLQGSLTVETVTDLREAIREAFEQPEQLIHVDASELTDIDFFGLQLICSAHRTSIQKNKLLTWHETRPSQIDDSMQVSGYTRHCGCTLCPPNVECMWI